MPCAVGMSKCHRSCRHRAFVTQYQEARAADVERRDADVGSYGEGSPEFDEYQPPPIVFKQWLQQMSGWGGEQETTE